MAASRDSRSCCGSLTRRMPRPPPPATALTNTGKPISSAPATSSSMFADGGVDSSVGTPDSVAVPRIHVVDVCRRSGGVESGNASCLGCLESPDLVAGQLKNLGGRTDEYD